MNATVESKKANFVDTMKLKAMNAKLKAKQLTKDAVDFCKDNPQMGLVLVTTAASAVGFGVKSLVKRANLNKEANLKEMYCYDRSLGHYWKLRRSLTTSEWRNVEDRKARGEKLGDILESMKVLR